MYLYNQNLSVYYAPGTILGTGARFLNQTEISVVMQLIFYCNNK